MEQARLKVQRANEHINALDLRLRQFSKSDSYVIHVDYNAEAGHDFMRLETVETVPDELLLITGDALNNLRSSLDYLIHGMCPIAREFPIYGQRKYFEDAMKGTLKKAVEAHPMLINFILEHIQPYQGGYGEWLWRLNSLNNIDKHRLLIARRQLTFVNGIRAIDCNATELTIPTWLIVYPHIAAEPVKGHTGVTITDKGTAACSLVFGEGMPMEGTSILTVLREIEIFVLHTINFIKANVMLGQH